MPAMKVLPVIMSGGSGTRLWPVSTDRRPKQFHALGGKGTMIEETALRLTGHHGDIDFLAPVIIANAAHGELIASLFARQGIRPSAIILEPIGRNTAAAAALAAMIAGELAPDASVLLTPADHLVFRPDAFLEAIRAAAPVVGDRIVTFGITPTGPETGYGYIRQGDAVSPGAYRIAAFQEKPDTATAARYLSEGGYSWNSGVFFFSPSVMLGEFSIAAADIREGVRQAFLRARREDGAIVLDLESFSAIRSEAVDRAVMEKTERAAVIPCDIGWADIGSWAELWRLSEKDGSGNVAEGDVGMLDCTNTLVRADGLRVSVIGMEDVVIVASGGAVLVMPRSRAQDVKKVIPVRE